MANNPDNGCTVRQAAELGWDKDQRILAYRGRTIDSIHEASTPGAYIVEYDCTQADLVSGVTRLDILVPLKAAKLIEDELAVTNKLLEERQRLLKTIPECPDHGECVPHAIEWVNESIELRKRC